MKRLMDYLKEQKVADFKVGQSVKWNPQQVSDYVDIQACGGFDQGIIKEVGASTFTIRCDNGYEVKIKKEDIYATGGEDAQQVLMETAVAICESEETTHNNEDEKSLMNEIACKLLDIDIKLSSIQRNLKKY